MEYGGQPESLKWMPVWSRCTLTPTNERSGSIGVPPVWSLFTLNWWELFIVTLRLYWTESFTFHFRAKYLTYYFSLQANAEMSKQGGKGARRHAPPAKSHKAPYVEYLRNYEDEVQIIDEQPPVRHIVVQNRTPRPQIPTNVFRSQFQPILPNPLTTQPVRNFNFSLGIGKYLGILIGTLYG